MLINIDSNVESVVKHDICDFHKKHPEQRWPGCTCSSSISLVKKNGKTLLTTPQMSLVRGECVKCHKKGFVAGNGFCIKCTGELEIKKIEMEKHRLILEND